MKKIVTLMIASAFALTVFVSCNDDLEVSPNESYFASEATITSSDSNVTITGNEAEVTFKVEGGTVTFTVDCGCDWTATSYKPEYFTATTTSTSVTITAVQNTVENQLAGVVSLMTAGESIQFARIQVYQNAYGAPEITVAVNGWNAPAVGALTTEIAVDASDDWSAEADEEWLTVEKTTDSVILTAAENEETRARTSTVTLTCTDGVKTTNAYIAVNQDGAVYLNISAESLSFDEDGGEEDVTVESNFDWDYSCESSDWLTFVRNGNVLTVTAASNETDEEREGTITFTTGDGAENVAEVLLTATQWGGSAAMVLTYTITSANTSTNLPLSGDVDCIVDWGDGSEPETITSPQPAHTYVNAGEYDITIDGTVTALSSSNITSSTDILPLTAVKKWGKTGLVDMQNAFWYCSNLVSLPETTGSSLSNVTTFYQAFQNCSSLEKLPDDLFASCSKAETFYNLCYNCTSLKEIQKGLFEGCVAATNLGRAFRGCTALTSVDAGVFSGCSNVTSFTYVFNNCKALTEIPAGLFDGCVAATDISYAFYQSGVSSIPEGLFDDCLGVTDFTAIFYQCTNLTTVPETLFAKCTEVTTFLNVFSGCTGLTSIPVGIFSNNLKVTNFNNAFYQCASLTGESPYNIIDGVKVHLYERADYPDIYDETVHGSSCFKNCIDLDDYLDIPSTWK